MWHPNATAPNHITPSEIPFIPMNWCRSRAQTPTKIISCHTMTPSSLRRTDRRESSPAETKSRDAGSESKAPSTAFDCSQRNERDARARERSGETERREGHTGERVLTAASSRRSAAEKLPGPAALLSRVGRGGGGGRGGTA